MDQLNNILTVISNFVWGWPMALILLGAGLVLTLRTVFIQLRGFKHGPVCTKQELYVQRAFLQEWVTAVSAAIGKGWSKEKCLAEISFLDRFPVDIGQEYMGEHVTSHNISALYDQLTAGMNG